MKEQRREDKSLSPELLHENAVLGLTECNGERARRCALNDAVGEVESDIAFPADDEGRGQECRVD